MKMLPIKDIVVGNTYKVIGELLLNHQSMEDVSQTNLPFGLSKIDLKAGSEVKVTDIFNIRFIPDSYTQYSYKSTKAFTGTRSLYVEYNGFIYDVVWNEFRKNVRKT